MLLRHVARGVASYIPGIYRVVRRKGTGGSDSATYCYDVWLKHLTLLWKSGLRTTPLSVAEIGPGDSLGVGLAALLSGSQRYFALDVYRYANTERTLRIFEELVAHFQARAPRTTRGWPDFDDQLDKGLFPSQILTEAVLDASLAADRLAAIRAAIRNPGRVFDGVLVDYFVPWTDPSVIRSASIDLVLSHSVLEHVRDLETTYRALHEWLKPGGWSSHQIDFTSHGLAEIWNGHWSYSEPMWKLILGKRPFLINRLPFSHHLALLQQSGLDIALKLALRREDGVARVRLARRWRDIDDEDLNCAGAFIQARRPIVSPHLAQIDSQ